MTIAEVKDAIRDRAVPLDSDQLGEGDTLEWEDALKALAESHTRLERAVGNALDALEASGSDFG